MIDIFISHSSIDKSFARELSIDLASNGVSVWLDEWEILVGDSIVNRIQEGLSNSRFVGVLLTSSSVDSGWVEKEWQSKIGEEAENKGVSILPLKFEDCVIPLILRNKKYADFSANYQSALNELVQAIKGHEITDRPATGKHTKSDAKIGGLVVTDIIVDCKNQDSTATVDFRIINRGHSPQSISRVRFEVVEILSRFTGGSWGALDYSDIYDLDSSNLDLKGQIGEVAVSHALASGEIDRFAVVLSAHNIPNDIDRKWIFKPCLVTSAGNIFVETIEVLLP